MYHLRRAYKSKPGQARKVVTLDHIEAQILEIRVKEESLMVISILVIPQERKIESSSNGRMT